MHYLPRRRRCRRFDYYWARHLLFWFGAALATRVAAGEEAVEDVALNRLQKGCLYNRLSNHNQLRVCNSEDYFDNETDPVEQGICRAPEFDYLEIRIKCQDWESVIFGSWVLQILLSEILGVPTTLETGMPDAVMQYYDADNRFDFGTTSNNLQAFRNAVELGNGDCRNVVQNSTDPEDYINCAHVIPEVWTARSKQVQDYIREDILDPPLALGALGVEGWYIPKFTAEADPSLTSWIGIQGEENRHKLARTFKRPTKWIDYCEQVSADNCTTPDDVAQRPPEDEWEASRLHKSGVYTGYFRPTELGDCEANPTNCTGHIGDFPCGWGGALEATCHWLNIALESNGDEPNSGGYTYGQLGQMWRAANETRNHVAMMWVVPDPVYEEFLGTEFEFVRVTLPPPTVACHQNKINPEHRCEEDPALRLGVAEGVCDEAARPLHKLLLTKFYDLTQGPSIPIAIRNPAHPVVSQFSLSELQINDMFRYWLKKPDDPREAICDWVVDNLEDLQQLIPRSYPRTIRDITSTDDASKTHLLSTALGTLAALLATVTAALVYRFRVRRVFRYAQTEFLYLLLTGSVMVSAGAILTGLKTPPSDGACVSQVWLVSLGYTLQLVPLLVKVAAINSLMQAAQRMRRITLKRQVLHGGVAGIGMLVTVFLIVWTTVDPPKKEAHYKLTEQVLVNGDGKQDVEAASLFDTTIVQIQYFCSSDSDGWVYVTIAWNLVLILCATALAFQSRGVKQHFNEAIVLSRLIYAHFLFVLLRVMAQFFEPAVGVPMTSMVYSLDAIVMVLVYFVPKFLADDHQTGILGGQSTAYFNSGVSGMSMQANSHSNFGLSGVEQSSRYERPSAIASRSPDLICDTSSLGSSNLKSRESDLNSHGSGSGPAKRRVSFHDNFQKSPTDGHDQHSDCSLCSDHDEKENVVQDISTSFVGAADCLCKSNPEEEESAPRLLDDATEPRESSPEQGVSSSLLDSAAEIQQKPNTLENHPSNLSDVHEVDASAIQSSSNNDSLQQKEDAEAEPGPSTRDKNKYDTA